MTTWTGFHWFRTRTVTDVCDYGSDLSVSIKAVNFLTVLETANFSKKIAP